MAQSTEGTILQITLHPEIEKLLGKKKPNNCKTGERQTVYPIKTHKDIIAMANWLYEHKDNKYVLAFKNSKAKKYYRNYSNRLIRRGKVGGAGKGGYRRCFDYKWEVY